MFQRFQIIPTIKASTARYIYLYIISTVRTYHSLRHEQLSQYSILYIREIVVIFHWCLHTLYTHGFITVRFCCRHFVSYLQIHAIYLSISHKVFPSMGVVYRLQQCQCDNSGWHITRERTENWITSRVQKVWVVEFVHGPTEIPQWPFLSPPVRALEGGVCPKLHPKTVWITFSRTSTKYMQIFSWLNVDYGFQVRMYRKWCKTDLRTTYRGRPGNI